MIQVVFKGMEKSQLAIQAVEERLGEVLSRFSDTERCRVVATLSNESPSQHTEPDLFRVKLRFERGRYHGLVLEESAPSFYVALADICGELLKRLNHFDDRAKITPRQQPRKLASRN